MPRGRSGIVKQKGSPHSCRQGTSEASPEIRVVNAVQVVNSVHNVPGPVRNETWMWIRFREGRVERQGMSKWIWAAASVLFLVVIIGRLA